MRLAALDWGADNPRVALLVHGGRDAATTWKKVGPWLAGRGYHVIAVDLPGHGDSAVPPGHERSLDRVAADLVETMQALRPDTGGVDVLIGHSLGGIVSLACVAEHPDFARRLVVEDRRDRASIP